MKATAELYGSCRLTFFEKSLQAFGFESSFNFRLMKGGSIIFAKIAPSPKTKLS